MSDNIAKEIQAAGGWLVWKSLSVNGSKPRKIPIYATTGQWRRGVQGSEADRKGLVSFAQATEVLASITDYSGLGLAMLPDWDLVAVDFDDCIDADNCVTQAVAELVNCTYWELSPSGGGVRAFFKGQLRDGKSISAEAKTKCNRSWGVEFFCSKGFVTLTGNIIGEPKGVAALSDEIKALHSATIGVGSGSADAASGTSLVAEPVGLSNKDIENILLQWDASCGYDTWVRIGMALHHETGGSDKGFVLWDSWSQTGTNKAGGSYAGLADCRSKWLSFGKSGSVPTTIRWMISEKPLLDVALESVAKDFEVIPPAKEASGLIKRALPVLKMDKNGSPDASPDNLVSWFRRSDLTDVVIGYDTFRDEIMLRADDSKGVGTNVAGVTGRPTGSWAPLKDSDYTRFLVHLAQKSFKPVSKDMVRAIVALVAEENPFDSAQVWLESLEWDGISRVKNFLSVYLGAENDVYTRAVSMYAWTAHAGRVMEAGCKADMIPVLVGPQMLGKSECVAAIAPAPEFFTDMAFSTRDDDLARRMRGRLVVECAELSGLGGRETEAVKAFITKTHEDWVPKYKEFSTVYPRRFLFWGTSNTDDFLSDATGNRRWLPIRVGKRGGQVEKVRADRNQLWAESLLLWEMLGGVATKEASRLGRGVHEEFTASDLWEHSIIDWLDERRKHRAKSCGPEGTDGGFSSGTVLAEALGIAEAGRNNNVRMRLRNVMLRLGYKLKNKKVGGHVYKKWVLGKAGS